MQDLIILAALLIMLAIGVGTLASMLGIGGGVIMVPLLIIVFGLSPLLAPSTTLLAALFAAIGSSLAYHRQKPRPVIVKAGVFLAATSVPGSVVGVWLRLLVPGDFALRLIFAVLLLPIAIRMLFAKKKGESDYVSEVGSFQFSRVTNQKLVYSLIGSFCAGILSGLLGIGGGVLMVPVFSMVMGLPMHAAVATSMLTMIFTAMSGTVMNYLTGEIDLFYSAMLSIGMVTGAQFGPKLIRRVNAVRLKQIFGVVLVLPLIKMAELGQLWLDPTKVSYLIATVGDIIIWLAIVTPVAMIRVVQSRRQLRTRESPTQG